ncbi:hypothetical protein NQ036_02615 [Brevibacterium sp. 91QC2O2]|nr:hypothetical protein [Brevibacterium sp. 91QC2O2]MCQ9367140.1 hypothetical protein [Brevibacterium sp. 91QC2O2]
MGEQRVEANVLIKQYRNFLDQFQIRTSTTRFDSYRTLKDRELLDALANDFQTICAMPVQTDWISETIALPDSPLRTALALGLSLRVKTQSWWDQARFILSLTASPNTHTNTAIQNLIRKSNPYNKEQVEEVERRISKLIKEYDLISEISDRLGWNEFADLVYSINPEPFTPDAIITQYNEFLDKQSFRSMQLGHAPVTRSRRSPADVISYHFAHTMPFNPLFDWPTEISRLQSTELSSILWSALQSRVKTLPWVDQADFITTAGLRNSPGAQARLREMTVQIRLRGSSNSRKKDFTEILVRCAGDRNKKKALADLCTSVGWSEVAQSLSKKETKSSNPTRLQETRGINTLSGSIPQTKVVSSGSRPCAVVLVGESVAKEILRQFQSLKDVRLDQASRFLAEELTIHKHWRLYLSEKIPVKWRGGSGNVSIIDISVIGASRLYVQFFQANGIVQLSSGSTIDQLGLSSYNDTGDRSNSRLRLLTNIAILYVFGETGSIFKTSVSEYWRRAEQVSGNKFYPTDVYRIEHLIENDRARAIAPELTTISVPPEPTTQRKPHNTRGYKRRVPSGGHTLVSAYRTGGKKRK